MAIARLFKSTQLSSNYIFKDGTMATFIRGRYHTTNAQEIAELEAEVKARHPYITIDENEKEVDTTKLDPMNALKEQLRAEIRAEMAAAVDPENNFGDYESDKLNPASTTTIAPVAAGGDGGQSANLSALLAKMHAGKK